MVGDNGVTHDLRRFLINSGAGSPLTCRSRATVNIRDTHQLILAVRHRQPSEHDQRCGGNRLARISLTSWTREIGTEALIGVASAYIR